MQSASMAAAEPLARLAAALPAPRKLKAISLHLFQVSPEDAADTCQAAIAMGYTQMEATYKELQACWPQITPSPLMKVSVEAQGTDVLLAPGKEHDIERVFEDAQKWGFEYVGISYNGGETDGELSGRSYLDRYRIFAERFNRAGVKARSAGLKKLLYHNMPFGFTPSNGTCGHQIVWDALDQNNCAIQLDVYWVKLSGHDPGTLLKQLSGRVKVMHMKDLPSGLPVAYVHQRPEDVLDIGTGSLDWAAILRAAESAGVANYTVEPPDVKNGAELMVHAKRSYEYLSKLEF
jgi:sugar phosphate isomerase/epimerase